MLLGCYIPSHEFRQNPLLLGLIALQKEDVLLPGAGSG